VQLSVSIGGCCLAGVGGDDCRCAAITSKVLMVVDRLLIAVASQLAALNKGEKPSQIQYMGCWVFVLSVYWCFFAVVLFSGLVCEGLVGVIGIVVAIVVVSASLLEEVENVAGTSCALCAMVSWEVAFSRYSSFVIGLGVSVVLSWVL